MCPLAPLLILAVWRQQKALIVVTIDVTAGRHVITLYCCCCYWRSHSCRQSFCYCPCCGWRRYCCWHNVCYALATVSRPSGLASFWSTTAKESDSIEALLPLLPSPQTAVGASCCCRSANDAQRRLSWATNCHSWSHSSDLARREGTDRLDDRCSSCWSSKLSLLESHLGQDEVAVQTRFVAICYWWPVSFGCCLLFTTSSALQLSRGVFSALSQRRTAFFSLCLPLLSLISIVLLYYQS